MTTRTLDRSFYEYEADVYRITPEAESALAHRRTLVERLLPRDPRDLGARVLDAGCGDGVISGDLASRGAQVTGLDLAWKRVSFARRRSAQQAAGGAALHYVQGSIYDLPFPDGSFDTVLCTDLLEHLDDPQRAVSELVRVSSRWALVTAPYSIEVEKTLCPHCLKDHYLYGHQHSFGKEGLEQLAAAAGGEVERFEHVIPMFECRRYRYFPPLKWLIWDHFKNSGTLGALLRKPGG